jgi:hypothetical protein
MCLTHWKLVPVALQKAVWAAYVAGQEVRKDPSPEYTAAAKAAVQAVEIAQSGAGTNGRHFSKAAVEEAVAQCVLVRPEDGRVADPLFSGKK